MKNDRDIKQFKKYLTKMYGKKCIDYNWSCFLCRIWRLFDDLEGFLEEDKSLMEEGMLPPPKSDHK